MRFAKAGLVALALCALAACGGGDSKPGTGADVATTQSHLTTLRRGNGPEPDSLDPQRARTDAA
jgi:ABC-type oligopeptide transport system substrate-binding subunit